MNDDLANQPTDPAEEPQPERPREMRWTKIRAGPEALLFSSPRPVPEKEIEEALEATREARLRRSHEVTERSRLSLAALETLAIIAYRQPITLPEIQEVRGVNSASVVNTLFEKKLITTAGRKAVVETPFLYRTTPEFLVRFGLKELEEKPNPEELAEDMAATVSEPLPPEPLAGTVRAREYDEDDEAEDEDGEGEEH